MKTPTTIPFAYTEKQFITVPVTVNGTMTKSFILDTGIGLNLISKSICEETRCQITGKYAGKRMSGQEITVPLTSVKSLSLAGLELTNEPVGVFDMEELMPGRGIGGFLSIGFFRNVAFSVDYKRQTITIENKASLEKIRSNGTSVPIKIDKNGHAFGISFRLALPNGQEISAEVDTGSQALILNDRFMGSLGVSPKHPGVRQREGRDETGHSFIRYFSKVSGSVHFPHAATMGVESPEVMFQKIIYDGLVGHNFLREFTVTYNLPESEMIFRKP